MKRFETSFNNNFQLIFYLNISLKYQSTIKMKEQTFFLIDLN